MRTGDVYRIKMCQEDGISPKGYDTFRYKYIIIVGNNGNTLCGAVVTNTKDHPIIPVEFQYPLTHNGYKCFANCYKLHEIPSNKLTQDCYHGNISMNDCELIITCLKTSPVISKKKLKKFGLI